VYPLERIRKYLDGKEDNVGGIQVEILMSYRLQSWLFFFYGHGSCAVYNQENAYRRAAIERLLGWREKNSRESRFYFGHLSRKCWSLVLTRTEK
jgi:hypothetical protein